MAKAQDLSPELLLKTLQPSELVPLYWLYGTETYWIDKITERLQALVLASSPRGFNYDVFLGKETTAANLIRAARTMPMMAPLRLILLKDANDLKAAELEAMRPYLAAPSAETVLVLISDKADKRTKFAQEFQQRGRMIECKTPPEAQLASWVQGAAKEQGLRIDGENAELLVQVVGSSLGGLQRAIEKLVLYVLPRQEALRDDIVEAVADTRARSVFELTGALLRRDLGAALMVLRRLSTQEKQGEAMIPLLGMISWQWRQLLKGSILKARGLGKAEAMKELGVFYKQADEIWAALQRFDARELRDRHVAIVEADMLLKSSPLSGSTIMEGLCMKLCARSSREAQKA